MFQNSVGHDTHYFPAPFGGPVDSGYIGFTMDVDELDAGPVVIRLTGTIDHRTAAPFGQCIDEVLVPGRSLILDMLGVDGVPDVVTPIVHAAVLRLSGTGARVVVACTGPLAERLHACVPRVRCTSDVASAFSEASATGETVPQRSWIDASEALQGRYL